MEAKDIVFTGGINTDDEARLIPNGDYRWAKYTRSGSAESQNSGAVESMPGNLLVDNLDLPAGTNTVIGSAKWVKGNSILYCVHNSNGDHTIWAFNINTYALTLVLGNIPGVGFAGTALNFRIDQKIYHTNTVQDLFYWTDGYFNSFLYSGGVLPFNPPRKINIDKAIKYMASSGTNPDGYLVSDFDTYESSFQTLDALKAPPVVKPICSYQTNTDKQFNKLYGTQPQFAYQYIYDDNEESKWSMYSTLLIPDYRDFVSGRDFQNPLIDNEISISFYTGPNNVRKFRLAYRNGDNGVWQVFKELDKTQDSISDYTLYSVVFDGNESLTAATNTEYNYDEMPQVAYCQEVLSNNRLAYANYWQDYDLLESIDITAERIINNVEYNGHTYKETPYITPLYGLSGRQADGSGVTNIYFTAGDWDSSVELNYTFDYMEGDVIEIPLYRVILGPSTIKNYYYEITYSDVTFVGTNFQKLQNLANNVRDYLISQGISCFITLTLTLEIPGYNSTTSVALAGRGLYPSFQYKILRRNFAVRSLKKGSKKIFGIQYYDRGNRSGSVQTKSNVIPIELDIPLPSGEDLSSLTYPNNPYYVTAQLTINHTPPEWATHYQIMVKKDELISNFQQTSVINITQDPDSLYTVLISLDDKYTSVYKGATINQTPQKGDIVRFIKKSIQNFPFTDANGYYYPVPEYCDVYYETEVLEYKSTGGINGGPAIVVSEFDYGNIISGYAGGKGAIIEIYTPKRDVQNEVWYEIQDPANPGEGYVILNPHTSNRAHAGNIQNQTSIQPAIVYLSYGDVWLRARQYSSGVKRIYVDGEANLPSAEKDISALYYVQVSDTQYEYWRWNPIADEFLQIYNWQYNIFPDMIYSWIEDYNYSDYYTSNSLGLGRLGASDINAKRRLLKSSVTHSLAYVQNSFINGLSSFQGLDNSLYLDDSFGSINKLKQVGYTLKSLQDRKETSIYIQKAYATGGDGTGQLSYTDKVFGGINPYDSLFGTIHPGSVQLIEGDLYYFDVYSGSFIRTSNNGQNDISSGKYKFNYWTTNKSVAVNAEPDKYEIISMIDENNMEYTCFFGRKQSKNSVVDSSEGVVFSYDRERWINAVYYTPVWAETFGIINVSWPYTGQLYSHNDGPELEFYGSQKTQQINFVMNESAITIKRPLTIGFRSNGVFNLASVKTIANGSYPEMESEIPSSLFKVKEGYYWASYLRDKTNTNASDPYLATAALALQNGRQLRGYVFEHIITQNANTKVVLFSVKTTFVPSPALI